MSSKHDSDDNQQEYETLIVKSVGPCLTITINRPEALNALNEQVLEELEEALLNGADPSEHRVIVLQGSGDKAFVAGADIGGFQNMTPDDALSFAQFGQSITGIIETLPQVVIAKVRGFALGGGCELAMACDLIVAGKSARFGQPEVNLGIIPGFGGTQRLAKRVGLPLALDMLLTGRGRTLTGDEAVAYGLASRCVEDALLDQEIEKIVSAIVKTGPIAVETTKRLTRESLSMPLELGLGSEASAFALCFARDEQKEGVQAFLNKKTPKFS